MAKKNYSLQDNEKKELGKLIRELRESKKLSLRCLADAISISPSNLTYIERGVNAPTGEIYQKIMDRLKPDKYLLNRMDKLYLAIRNLPPPDICAILIKNPNLFEQIRQNKN